jgi:hypothetical protein
MSLGGGWKQITLDQFVGRDFAILCSQRYREFTTDLKLPGGKTVTLKCLAFAEHEWYAHEMLKIVSEAIPVYSQWFGPFPYTQFTIAESYFGWNGNECAGLIMIDERVFDSPHVASGYVEYLVSHETSHQWWYNMVGTNGYSETFMDEACASYFTHRLLDRKHGKNNPFMLWPQGLRWLPNIYRENYHWSGTYYAIRNGDMYPAAQDLPRYGHLFNLFTGAYDRGSKALGMIESQMGEAAFLDFTRMVAAKYSWKVLQIADYRRELEAYTGRDWGEFFERWIYGKGLTDWKLETVKITPASATEPLGPLERRLALRRAGARNVDVVVKQVGEYLEPTIVGLTLPNGEMVRVPVGGDSPLSLPEMNATVTPLGNNRWNVKVALPAEPEQIEIDPERVLLDANPYDNIWRSKPRFRATLLYTMVDEADLASDYDRWNFTAGPWLWGPSYEDPWYTRSTMVGLRAGANKPQQFRGGFYAAYRTDFRDIVAGVDATILGDHMEYGLNWERRIGGPFGDQDGSSEPNRVSAYVRQVLKQSSSLYLPPTMYQDAFITYQDNFLPFSRSPEGERWNRMVMGGYHFRLYTYTPYWDPETGVWVDVAAGSGVADFAGWRGMGQGSVQLAGVQHLPESLGWLSNVRVAGRIVAMGSWPQEGQFFALGGGTLFRGFDLAERQGSALWVANTELRIPLARNVEWDVLDHVFGGRNLWLASFYDVGSVYANGRSVGGVAHALGMGLRLDVAIFSFIERSTLRLDVAKTLNSSSPFQIWFGIQQAF